MGMAESAQNIKAALRAASPPFILTLLMAAIAWWISHTVDRITSAPTVKYSLEEGRDNSCHPSPCLTVTFRIHNLSDTLFENLVFNIEPANAETKSRLEGATPITESPAMTPQVVEANNAFTVAFSQLHPGAKATVSARISELTPIVVTLINSDKAINLVKPSIETVFVECEMWLLLAGLIGMGVLTFCVLRRK